jgi:hypothetical protein
MKVIGILLVLTALAIGLVPHFTNCSALGRAIQLPDGRTIPMKCHWTANAAVVVSVLLLAIGSMILFGNGRQGGRQLSILAFILGVAAIFLPTSLIGVCASDEMMCKLAMEPTMIFSGIVSSIAGLTGFFLSGKTSTENLG